MDTVSVIVVSWNTRDYLRQCLDSLLRPRAACLHEVIVVDNASCDGSPELVASAFPGVKLIRAGANLGFARANNLAMGVATGSLVALVNSDALAHPGSLDTLATYLAQHPDVGLVGPRVLGRDGLLQRTCRKFPGLWNTTCRTLAIDRVLPQSTLFGGYELPDRVHAREGEVDVLSGCFCLVRRSVICDVGGMDERFFFYGEDIDWCKRIRARDWKIVFLPQASATHFGGASSSKEPLRYSVEILRATLQYWRKHHGRGARAACRALLVAHHGVRLGLRLAARTVGGGGAPAARAKLHEDAVCLRWLFGASPSDGQEAVGPRLVPGNE